MREYYIVDKETGEVLGEFSGEHTLFKALEIASKMDANCIVTTEDGFELKTFDNTEPREQLNNIIDEICGFYAGFLGLENSVVISLFRIAEKREESMMFQYHTGGNNLEEIMEKFKNILIGHCEAMTKIEYGTGRIL